MLAEKIFALRHYNKTVTIYKPDALGNKVLVASGRGVVQPKDSFATNIYLPYEVTVYPAWSIDVNGVEYRIKTGWDLGGLDRVCKCSCDKKASVVVAVQSLGAATRNSIGETVRAWSSNFSMFGFMYPISNEILTSDNLYTIDDTVFYLSEEPSRTIDSSMSLLVGSDRYQIKTVNREMIVATKE